MNKQLLKYAKKLTTNKNPLSIYKELETIMYNVGLYEEQVGLIKNIWHITKDNDLLLTISDIYAGLSNNYNAAYDMCNLYFQKTNPYFYERYMTLLNRRGYNEFEPKFDMINYSAPVFQYIDKYSAIIYMMVYLNQEKKLQELLELTSYLKTIDSQIYECMLRLSDKEKEVYKIVISCNNHLSELLSQNEHHNDINKFAIKLNPYNEQAYLNIIDDYISDGKKELALDFYNSNYVKVFKKNEISTLIQLYWSISDVYSSKGYKFKAVQYQKYAIDSELNKG